MPHVSRNKLSPKTEIELIKQLNLVLNEINKKEDMADFLSALLSPTEKIMLAKRLAVIVLLEENISDAQIARSLHLTRITVMKTKYFYESEGKGYHIALKKLKEQKQYDQFKKFLISLAKYSIRAAGGYVKPTILD